MSFESDLEAFKRKMNAKQRVVFFNVASAIFSSIQNGSPVTGSPGQPVGQYGPGYNPGKVGGFLKASWQLTFPAPDKAEIKTDAIYGPVIEYNIRGAQLRSTVGGFHSVAITIAGTEKILAVENAKLKGV